MGDQDNCIEKWILKEKTQPGCEIVVEQKFKAPEEPGEYNTFYRFCMGQFT